MAPLGDFHRSDEVPKTIFLTAVAKVAAESWIILSDKLAYRSDDAFNRLHEIALALDMTL